MPLLGMLIEGCGAAASGNPIAPRLLGALGAERLQRDYDEMQRPLLEILIGEYAAMSDAQRYPGMAFLADAASPAGAAQGVLAATQMVDAAARKALFSAGAEAVAQSDDPLVHIARSLAAERAEYLDRRSERSGRMLDLGRRWIEAQEAFRGKAFYPDANSTLRVSIAEVAGYEPRDGLVAMPHTTVAGIVQKHSGQAPFNAPPALLAAAGRRQQSRWVDPRLRDVPVCFLTNGDTTGGNSGSPVIDGKGRLIGLNFDRVFEGVATDFGWHPARSRNVVVDIRYALWVIDEVFPCPRLLAELGAAR
jgi:hypothetical protein